MRRCKRIPHQHKADHQIQQLQNRQHTGLRMFAQQGKTGSPAGSLTGCGCSGSQSQGLSQGFSLNACNAAILFEPAIGTELQQGSDGLRLHQLGSLHRHAHFLQQLHGQGTMQQRGILSAGRHPEHVAAVGVLRVAALIFLPDRHHGHTGGPGRACLGRAAENQLATGMQQGLPCGVALSVPRLAVIEQRQLRSGRAGGGKQAADQIHGVALASALQLAQRNSPQAVGTQCLQQGKIVVLGNLQLGR